jgi:hypothetical protein
MMSLKAGIFLTFGAVGIVGCGSSGGQGGADGGHQDATSHPKSDTGITSSAPDAGASVLQHHANLSRDGHYIDPLMTKAYAAKLTLDTAFDGIIGGPLWGQPLYVENGVGGKGTYYVADDSNGVYALDETTGKPDWSKVPLVEPASSAGSGCGNVKPVGVTGTPIIDFATRAMFFVAAEGTGSGINTQKIHAVSIDTGNELSSPGGWPIDVSNISAGGTKFSPQPQGQRSALSLVNGILYVPFGGEDGDCGSYHGWVVTVPIANPGGVTAYATPAAAGGIWAVGGMSSDGTDVFAVTGNAFGTSSIPWSQAGSEAVLRFHNGSSFSGDTTDFFTPSNWQDLDNGDTDLGGTGAVVVDVPGATPSALVVALGKSGVVHILDRSNLGGIGNGNGTTGEGLYSNQAASGAIKTAPAVYATAKGTYVVFHSDGTGASCPNGQGGDLTAVIITATKPPKFTTAWCANSGGAGAPIVTTTDAAGSNAIVWIAGAEGTNHLSGLDGDTGESVFSSNTHMDNVIHFTSPIDVKGKIVVGSTDKVYVFGAP